MNYPTKVVSDGHDRRWPGEPNIQNVQVWINALLVVSINCAGIPKRIFGGWAHTSSPFSSTPRRRCYVKGRSTSQECPAQDCIKYPDQNFNFAIAPLPWYRAISRTLPDHAHIHWKLLPRRCRLQLSLCRPAARLWRRNPESISLSRFRLPDRRN